MKTTRLKLIALLIMFIGGAFWLTNCGGGGGGGATTTPSGSVGLFMTDDASNYQQVAAVINSVSLVNSSDGSSCSVLTTPVNINLSDLAGVLQLINTTSCPADHYNRMDIAFSNAVGLTNSSGISNACAFTTYLANGTPNALTCINNTCTMDLTGDVDVLTNQNNQAAADFVLKDFVVNGFGTSSCTVTMKASPLNASQMNKLGYVNKVSGTVASFNSNSATIDTGSKDFVVNTTTSQSNFQNLMSFAQQKGFSAVANCASFDFNAGTCSASQVQTLAVGTVQNATASTFTLTLPDGSAITVDYSSAPVKGQLENGQVAVTELIGIENSGVYDASQVQSRAGMGAMGTMPSGGGMPGGGPMM